MNEIKINKPVYDRINDLEQWKGVKIGKYWILRTQFGYLVYLYSMINDDEVDPIYSSREVQDIIDYIDGKINEIKRLQQLAGINEIKIINPTKYTGFPIRVNNMDEFKEAVLYLKNKGYTWNSGNEINGNPIIGMGNFPLYISKPTKVKTIQINMNPKYQDAVNSTNKNI